MGMSVAGGGGGGGRRRGRGRRNAPVSEINITPMVDVMLVLLIIFMVAAPMMTVGVPIDLPKTAAPQMNTDQQPVIVSVNPEGAIFLDETPVQLSDLPAALQAQGVDPEVTRINVRGDLMANYGSVAQVMGILASNGYSKIGLITEQAQQGGGQ